MISRKATIEFAVVGAIASAICWITPFAGWILQAVGLESWVASLDLVMLPMMSLFIGLGIGTAWFRQRDDQRPR